MRKKISVVDYGMGNLHSVAKALASTGAQVTVSDDARRLETGDVLVLPGVGSFGAAMRNLRKKGLDTFVRNWVADGRPYLGICLGLQLLFEGSEESPGVKGLGILKGRVTRFRQAWFKPRDYRVPHMGWNSLARGKRSNLFKGLRSDDYFYFVHTFFPVPKNRDVVLTETVYGRKFCSGVSRGSLAAFQFHPEKSGPVGLRLLKNVLEGVPAS